MRAFPLVTLYGIELMKKYNIKKRISSSLAVAANMYAAQVLRFDPATPFSSRPNTNGNCGPANGQR